MFFRKDRAQREGRRCADPLIKTGPEMVCRDAEPWSDISDTPPDSTGHIGHHRTCFFGHYRTLNRTLIGHCTGHDRTVPDTNRTVQGTAMSKMSNLRPDRSDTNRTVPDRSDSRVIAASPMDATSPPRAHNSPGLSQACSRT